LNPILSLARRLLNPIGVDLVRYDPQSQRPPTARSGAKPSLPKRIVIGGGDCNYGPEWHNIEYVTQGYADKYRTLSRNIDIPHDLTSRRPFPIDDESILAAYSSHVIEHLKDEHVRFVLGDTYRVMQPGGYLRISCPNIDLYVRAFLEKDLEFFHYREHPHYESLGIRDSVVGLFLDVFATSLGERQRHYPYDEVRAAIEQMGAESAIEHYCQQVQYDYSKSHYHVNWFNPNKLLRMLREAGFREVYESALGQSRCPEMRDLTMFDMGDPKISMFIEGRK
jgi:predicted SAM-dependent methyltransferase